jgi:hypothetical protein
VIHADIILDNQPYYGDLLNVTYSRKTYTFHHVTDNLQISTRINGLFKIDDTINSLEDSYLHINNGAVLQPGTPFCLTIAQIIQEEEISGIPLPEGVRPGDMYDYYK